MGKQYFRVVPCETLKWKIQKWRWIFWVDYVIERRRFGPKRYGSDEVALRELRIHLEYEENMQELERRERLAQRVHMMLAKKRYLTW